MSEPACTRLACTASPAGAARPRRSATSTSTVDAGRILALLGPNGAGKTTLLLTARRAAAPRRPAPSRSTARRSRTAAPSLANTAGIVLVPDNRCLFTTLSVEENLRSPPAKRGPSPRDMLDVFPALEKRWNLRAGALSGGEQQMLAMARALIQQPKVLLIDELSMGLAPLVVESLFDAVRRIATDHGCAVVLVEQHVNLALEVADDAAVLNHGAIVLRGMPSSSSPTPNAGAAYLGDVASSTT